MLFSKKLSKFNQFASFIETYLYWISIERAQVREDLKYRENFIGWLDLSSLLAKEGKDIKKSDEPDIRVDSLEYESLAQTSYEEGGGKGREEEEEEEEGEEEKEEEEEEDEPSIRHISKPLSFWLDSKKEKFSRSTTLPN